jgi:acetyltransferase-like isoleucine patch superfamily enzyme
VALLPDRRVPHDWHDGVVPAFVDVDREAYLESSYIFSDCRCERKSAIRIARGAHIYSATIFDLGAQAEVEIGECSMLNGVRLICESRIRIGAYATISWNVIFMDSYRLPSDPVARRPLLLAAGKLWPLVDPRVPARPITLQDNVWIGFDVCVLPGVTIGEGAVVGARSVVTADVPAYTVAAGNPARVIRELPRSQESKA